MTGDVDREREMIALLQKLMDRAAALGLSLGHARRFFDVGEWSLAYEEIVHIPDADRLAEFKADNASSLHQLRGWCDQG